MRKLIFYATLFFVVGFFGDALRPPILPGASQASAQEARTWTDSTGKFRVEATLVSQDDASATLRKADGRTIKLPKAKLSAADRDFLTASDAENPFAGGELVDALASGGGSDGFGFSGKTTTLDGFALPVGVGERSGEKRLSLDGAAPGWNVAASAWSPSVGNRPVSLFSDPRIDKFGKNKYRLVAPTTENAPFYLGFNVGFGDAAKSFLERCDVAAGIGKIAALSAPEFRLTDVSPDGKYAVGVCVTKKKKFGVPSPAVLAFFPLDDFDGATTLAASAFFYPFFDSKAADFAVPTEITDAIWVDSEQILTTTREEAVLWNVASGRSVYSFPVRNASVALDPTRSVGTLATATKAVFFTPKTGEFLGKLDLASSATSRKTASPKAESAANAAGPLAALREKVALDLDSAFYPTKVAFSPDGAKIAAATAETLFVFDAKTGARLDSFPIDRAAYSAIGWAGSSQVLVSPILYDAATGVPLCEYSGASPEPNGTAFVGGRVWTVCGEALAGFEIPHTAAQNALKTLDLKKIFALYPGASISIQLELDGLLDEKEVRSLLEKKLTETGFKVVPKAAVSLTARYVQLDEEVEANYSVGESRGFLPPPAVFARRGESLGEVKLKAFEQTLEIAQNGKVCWKNAIKTTGPDSVEYDSEKTLEQTLREANRPEIEFFEFAPISKYVRSGGGRAVLSARLTPDGVR